MTDTANAPFHPRGCMTICQSNTPCLRIRAFRISRQVGFDKTHLRLCYHKAPAADTLIASGLLGIERRGVPHHPERLARTQLVSFSCWEVFSYPMRYLSLIKNGFLVCHCSHFLSFAERFWAIFDWDQFWEGLYEFLFEIRALVLPVCGF